MRALIADDHPVVRDATAALLRGRYGERSEIVRVGTYDGLLLALEMAAADLIIVDLDMPDLGPTRNLASVMRKVGDVPLVVFSSSRAAQVMLSARQQGASGYVCKADTPETLLRAVETVLAGDRFFQEDLVTASEVAARFLPSEALPTGHGEPYRACAHGGPERPDLPPLTPRQKEILQCLGDGLSNKQIARRLGISDSTVKVHLHGLFERLGVQNRTQAALRAPRSEARENRGERDAAGDPQGGGLQLRWSR